MNWHLTIDDRPGPEVSPRLFGQFLERASWNDETGPEAAVNPETGHLWPAVYKALKGDRLSIVRFPGGSDVDRSDWRDLVDGAHGPGPRPRTQTIKGELATRFGYDEYFQLAEDLGWETLLVLNFGDGLYSRKSPKQAALDNAGVLAYAVAAVGATLPDGMPDWPALRAANGHPEPYRLDELQIGNETWWRHKVQWALDPLETEDPAVYRDHFLACLHAMIPTIRAIAPDVPLIMDGMTGLDTEREILGDPMVREEVRSVCLHQYSPWSFNAINLDGENVPVDEVPKDAWWRFLVSNPGACDAEGRALAYPDDALALARELGYDIAITEWNWNGIPKNEEAPDMDLAPLMFLGSAHFLMGMVRQCDRIAMGCQSMLLGHAWDITSWRIDPTGQDAPFRFPQYAATTAFAETCRGALLPCSVAATGESCFEQPYASGYLMGRAHDNVSWLEAVATRDDDGRLRVLLINRHPTEAASVELEAPGEWRALHARMWTCLPTDRRPHVYDAVRDVEMAARASGTRCRLEIPPAALVTVVAGAS